MLGIIEQINNMYREAQKRLHDMYVVERAGRCTEIERRVERLEREVKALRRMVRILVKLLESRGGDGASV